MPLKARARTLHICRVSLQHSSLLAPFFLDRRSRSGSLKDRLVPKLSGHQSGCPWPSLASMRAQRFLDCPRCGWRGPVPEDCRRGPVSTGDLPGPRDRGLPRAAGPASDPGREFPHHPHGGDGSQQGDHLEGTAGDGHVRVGAGSSDIPSVPSGEFFST